jgi:hypothetical protein
VELQGRALEHGSTGPSRWLRERRVRVALWIALAEGILVVFDVIPEWTALLVALGIILFYVLVGRNLRWDLGRQSSWVAAFSQAVVALVPVLLFVLGVLAIVALAVLAVVAVIALFADRR